MTCGITQSRGERLGSMGDSARFWRTRTSPALDFLSASFTTHRYAPHRHDTYVVAALEAGTESLHARGERRYAAPGELVLLEPGELHDGSGATPSWRYRAIYPSPSFLARALADLEGDPEGDVAAPSVRDPVVRDPKLAAEFLRAHRLAEAEPSSPGAEAAIATVVAELLARHAASAARPRPPTVGAEDRRIRRVVELIRSEAAQTLTLERLAAEAGLSRFHFLRVFRRQLGQTPHAYQTDVRVREARRMLAAGVPPAAVAVAVGFSDQSHLNRVFKRVVGVTPGRYAAAGRA